MKEYFTQEELENDIYEKIIGIDFIERNHNHYNVIFIIASKLFDKYEKIYRKKDNVHYIPVNNYIEYNEYLRPFSELRKII